MNKYFVTTPIYYLNDVPHIGHTCTTIIADILARYNRLKNKEVFFLTGTDEHGQKIADSAAKEGMTPIEFCDKIAPKFIDAWNKINISNDFFIRTTDKRHENEVQKFLKIVFDNNDVYKGKYEGYYCIGCEKYLTETDLVDNKCPLHPAEKTVWKSEDNWFFRLSKYSEKLQTLIETDQFKIIPDGKKQEVLGRIKLGINDVSISREGVEWGIKTPWDETQTVYVWFDALINYYSATKFLDEKDEFWPANIHLIAKDILWFHAVIWPAMLLSANIELPKSIFCHSYYQVDSQKMSKSLGNVISPESLINEFGIDGSRFLIATSLPYDNDSDISMIRLKEKYNSDLANNLGNLVSRLANLAEGIFITQEFDENIEFDKEIENINIPKAIEIIFEKYINPCNEMLNKTEPWKMEKGSEERNKVLIECVKMLNNAAFLLKAIMPESADFILNTFNGEIINKKIPLFKRIQ